MILFANFCERRRRLCAGFTLVELMAAMAVLFVLLLMVTAIVNNTSSITGTSNKRMDADSEARMVFDRLAGDFSKMVNRGDVDYVFDKQTGNDALYFYSEAPASSSSATVTDNSSTALVGYRINSKYQLERLGKGMLWSGVPQMVFLSYTNGLPDNTTTLKGAFAEILNSNSNYSVLGENVFRIEFCFLLKAYVKADGTVVPAHYSNLPYNSRQSVDTPAGPGHNNLYGGLGLGDIQAIVVSLAILDTVSRKILPATVDWSKIAGDLADPLEVNLSAVSPALMAQTWQDKVNSGSLGTASGLPKAAANHVRIYQRIFYLSSRNP